MNVRKKPHVHQEGWKMLSKEIGPQHVHSGSNMAGSNSMSICKWMESHMGTIRGAGRGSLLRSSVRCFSMSSLPKDKGQIHRSVYSWVLRPGKFKDGKHQPWWLPRAGRGCGELVFSELSLQQDKEPWCVTVWTCLRTCLIDSGVHAWK